MSDLMGKGEVFAGIWTSTEDALPHINCEFGVCISETLLVHLTTLPGVSFGEMALGYYDKQRGWVSATSGALLESNRLVTHWMPLPKAPWLRHPTAGDKFKPQSGID